MPDHLNFTRRQLLMAGAAASVGASMAFTQVQARTHEHKKTKRTLRLAHLTDVHIQPEKGGGEGLAACLRHVQSQKDKPEFILFGGDNVMEVDGKGRERADVQLNLWKDVLKAECSLPYHITVGNHDVLGNDPVNGKKWAQDAYSLPNRYYTVDKAGWRFIFLDSTLPQGEGYKGKLDEEQFEWLQGFVQHTPEKTPICVISHIPICSASVFFDGENDKSGDWLVPGNWMHLDARRIKDLFYKHPNVRLCLSGHMHMVDACEYLGVKYACNGSVAGYGWEKPYLEFEPGYALVDLYEDGSGQVSDVDGHVSECDCA